jgi:hypothetical protein
MVAMLMVQVPVDQVVCVVAVRHSLVAAAQAVLMVARVPLSLLVRCAGRRMVAVDSDSVLVDVAVVEVV